MEDRPPTRAAARAGIVRLFLVALAALLVAIALGDIVPRVPGLDLQLRYKTLVRAVPALWVACLTLRVGRTALPYEPRHADLPLVLFALAAALSVALGGGHWGDVRSLVAALGLGWLARSLLGAPARRWLFLHYVGGTVVLVLACEILAHPELLLLREMNRYELVTGNPNMLGFLFAMTGPLFLAEACVARGSRRIGAALYLAAAVLGTLLTFSRTAAFGLALGTLVVTLHLERRGRALTWATLAILVFLAVERPDLWTATRQSGDVDRLRIMRTSLSLFTESPLLGIGFGINNLEERFPARYNQLYGIRLFRFHSANQVVDLLVGTGVIGTTLALWWAGLLGRAAAARVRASPSGSFRVRSAGALAALVAIAVMSLAEPPLYHGKLLPILFLVLAWTENPTGEVPLTRE